MTVKHWIVPVSRYLSLAAFTVYLTVSADGNVLCVGLLLGPEVLIAVLCDADDFRRVIVALVWRCFGLKFCFHCFFNFHKEQWAQLVCPNFYT